MMFDEGVLCIHPITALTVVSDTEPVWPKPVTPGKPMPTPLELKETEALTDRT
ncbi:MAG: hypothetical protein IT162_04125 [Bryobacterales bacterium]|nr:hypothetical protein [Bryobacterales bacterium]